MRHLRVLGVALAAVVGGCSAEGTGTRAIFELSPGPESDLYPLPYPSDLRLEADGTVDLHLLPRLEGVVSTYVDVLDAELRGAGTQAAVYFRFDGPVDASTLPADPYASVGADASAFIVDLTEGSPTYGARAPHTSRFTPDGGDFIGPNWLALRPLEGFPLRERTIYAAIVTNAVRAADGGAIGRAPDFERVMASGAERSGDPAVAKAAGKFAPLARWLETQPGLAPKIVSATVFTTLDATSSMTRLRSVVYTLPAPTLQDLVHKNDLAGYYSVFEGTFDAPNFQTGAPPYWTTGGNIEWDANGMPGITRTERLRVAMTIPEGEMPPAGWPVVLYAHGTGGDYRSFLYDKTDLLAKVTDKDGSVVSLLAVVSIDQPLHGPRAPADTNVDFATFNFQNILAMKDNFRQGAADDFSLLRLVKNIDIAAAPSTGRPIKFDPARIYFKGHSQGGLTGPLFLGAEPEVKAAVLSGAGGGFIRSIMEKTEPINIPLLVQAVLRDTADEYHPLMNLIQAFAEELDVANHARLMFREPPAGFSPKSVFQSLGIVDHYTPIPNIKCLALAMGVQPIEPNREPIDYLDLAQLAWGTAPASQNVAGGQATGVLLEYPQASPSQDGHFVVSQVADARRQSMMFLGTHAASGVAQLVPP